MFPRVIVPQYDEPKSTCFALWWAQEYMFCTMMSQEYMSLTMMSSRVIVLQYVEPKSTCFAVWCAQEYMYRTMMSSRVHFSHFGSENMMKLKKKGTNLLCNLLSVYWVNCLVVWFNIFVISALGGPDGEYIGFSEYSLKGPGWTIMPPADEGNRLDA